MSATHPHDRSASTTAVDPASVAHAARLLGSLATRDVPVGPLTTYRVGGAAALFVEAASVDDLRAVGRAAVATGLPVLVLGRGSNLLVSDDGFPGLVVLLGPFAQDVTITGTTVVAGGGVPLPVLARRSVAAGLTGLEWAVGVPGTVGGGVRMNAGGHGSDMAASLVGVHLVDLGTGEDADVPAAELGLRFRRSRLTDTQVVVRAAFALEPGDPAAGEAMLADIVRWRREHQPGGHNAGSVFVNPRPDTPAALLVDRVGLKGHRRGTAQVSDKHANFIQADDGGRAADVLALMVEVRRAVEQATGVRLRSEVRLVGFGTDAPDFEHGVGYAEDHR